MKIWTIGIPTQEMFIVVKVSIEPAILLEYSDKKE